MSDESPVTAAELFDAIGSGYEDAFGRPPVVDRAVRELLQRLPPGSRVLDVGSGTGRPVAADLTAAGHAVTGLDVSSTMVEIARRQVPGATFVHVDVRRWASPDTSWDAVCAFFPFLQMSRIDTAAVLADIRRWLVPGGWLALVTVPMDGERVPFDFLGRRVEITSFSAAAMQEQVEAAGLEVVDTRLEVFQPDKPGARAEEHLLVLAHRSEPVDRSS